MTAEERKAWERKQRETRIVDIAQEVFFEFGYENTTVLQIAKSAGYNKRTIYLYFKDKEEIFLAVVLRGLKILLQSLQDVVENGKGERNHLRKLGQGFFNFSLDHPEFLRLIMIFEANTCIYYGDHANAGEKSEYHKACQETTDAIADLMTSTIQKAKENNIIVNKKKPIKT